MFGIARRTDADNNQNKCQILNSHHSHILVCAARCCCPFPNKTNKSAEPRQWAQLPVYEWPQRGFWNRFHAKLVLDSLSLVLSCTNMHNLLLPFVLCCSTFVCAIVIVIVIDFRLVSNRLINEELIYWRRENSCVLFAKTRKVSDLNRFGIRT